MKHTINQHVTSDIRTNPIRFSTSESSLSFHSDKRHHHAKQNETGLCYQALAEHDAGLHISNLVF
jgi:hypothetical protein